MKTTFKQFLQESTVNIIKTKKGNIQLKEPIVATYNKDWKEYTFCSPKNRKCVTVDYNSVTTKKVKNKNVDDGFDILIIGCTPEIAKKLELETVGEKQGLSTQDEREHKREAADKLAKELFAKNWEKSPVRFHIRYMSIEDRLNAEKITKEEAEKEIQLLNIEFKKFQEH